MTIVLKLPLTRAASTNGLHKYNGFWVPGAVPEGDTGGAPSFEVGNVEEVGVGERLGPLGPERCMVRLPQSRRVSRKKRPFGTRQKSYRVPNRVKKGHDLCLGYLQDWRQHG